MKSHLIIRWIWCSNSWRNKRNNGRRECKKWPQHINNSWQRCVVCVCCVCVCVLCMRVRACVCVIYSTTCPQSSQKITSLEESLRHTEQPSLDPTILNTIQELQQVQSIEYYCTISNYDDSSVSINKRNRYLSSNNRCILTWPIYTLLLFIIHHYSRGMLCINSSNNSWEVWVQTDKERLSVGVDITSSLVPVISVVGLSITC